MKRILTLSFLIFASFTVLNAQEFGSWIVPPYRFDFYNPGVVTHDDLITPVQHYYFSDGAFKNNGELLFYIIDGEVYDENSVSIGYLGSNSYPAYTSEIEIISIPGQLNKFYVIWGWINFAGAELRYTTIDCSQPLPQITSKQLITSIINEAGFAITELQNGIRYLYVAKYGGLYKYEINSTGIISIGTIVSSSDPTLYDDSFFAARNLEINSNENVIAWTAHNFPNDLFIVYLNQGIYSSSHIIHLNNLEFSGIEFADINNNNILYASCEGTNGGIQHINYVTWQIGSPLTTNGSYGNTFLEKAIDGNIYGVSNDGTSLGKIYPVSNAFVPGVVTGLDIKSSLCYDGNTYKLPKDKTVYSPLNLSFDLTYVSCPGHSDGIVTANPSGGTPPYTYLWTPGGFTTQTVTGLPEGLVIQCCVTDDNGNGDEICDEIEITIDPLMFDYVNEYYINYPNCTLINWDKSFKAGLRIGPAGRVTMINCDLQFGQLAKLIIEPDGELTLDNCVLKNYEGCDDMWRGIEVWGNKLMHQYEYNTILHNRYQGMLTLKNGTAIENANIGVLLCKYTEGGPGGGFNENYDGGIIQVINNGRPDIASASFINNRQSIVFKPYKNYIPGNQSIEVDNISYLYNCYFNINSAYLGSNWINEHIHLFKVKGIKIKGSTFENNLTTTHSGHGINAWQAGYYVDALCNSGIEPCPELYTDKCYFRKFTKAVNLDEGGAYIVTVKNSMFIDNSNGVMLTHVNNPVILFNNFEIGYMSGDDCDGNDAGYGIDMISCRGFAVEENDFKKFSGAPSGNYIGIRCKDSYTNYDLIYKNNFNGLSYANFAEGNNRSSSFDLVGLEFQCNTNIGNNTDFIVTGNDPNSPPQIRTFQGTQTLSAGNTFSTNALWHFKNDGGQVIDYFYHNYPPLYYTPDLVVPYYVTNENGCLSHYGGGGGGTGGRTQLTQTEIEDREDAYEENLANYNNVNALYENLKDGGSTEVLQAEIETSWPNEMWELRAELLEKSPHLSQEVLMTAADKTDILPESILFEILSVNPDELRKEELLKYLEDKEQPLPEYMIDILRQLAGGITYKTILQLQMAKYNAGKSTALYDLIRSNLSDTMSDMNDLRNRLADFQNINADEQIISTYLEEGNYGSAQSLLNLIPSLYGLQDDELINYNDYKAIVNMQISIEQQGGNMMELDSTEVAALAYYAENSTGKARYMAQGILNFGYGYNYCNCPAINDSLAWKSSGSVYNKPVIANRLTITATPNPAKTWVVFDYNLPVNTINAVIEITDITGRNVATLQVNSSLKQYVWDIRQVERGIYLYRINAGPLSESGKLIIE